MDDVTPTFRLARDPSENPLREYLKLAGGTLTVPAQASNVNDTQMTGRIVESPGVIGRKKRSGECVLSLYLKKFANQELVAVTGLENAVLMPSCTLLDRPKPIPNGKWYYTVAFPSKYLNSVLLPSRQQVIFFDRAEPTLRVLRQRFVQVIDVTLFPLGLTVAQTLLPDLPVNDRTLPVRLRRWSCFASGVTDIEEPSGCVTPRRWPPRRRRRQWCRSPRLAPRTRLVRYGYEVKECDDEKYGYYYRPYTAMFHSSVTKDECERDPERYSLDYPGFAASGPQVVGEIPSRANQVLP